MNFKRLPAILCLLAVLTTGAQAQQVLKGHVPKNTRRLTPLHRLDSAAHLDLAIGLPLRNREQLTNLLEDIYRPGSPNFRHFLSTDEFTSSFGPSQQDYQSVIDFAKSHGLTVKYTHPNRTLLDVNGSVGDIEKTFHVHMQVFQHPKENREFFAPDVEPTVDIATPLLVISGLDSYVRPHPHINRVKPEVRPSGGGSGGGGGGNCDGTGEGLFGYAGYDFQAAYTPLTVLDGTGQSVGLFELSGYSSDDIDTYTNEYSLPGTTTLQNVYVGETNSDDSNEDFAIECTSDIEMAMAMAPGLSTVYVYEGPTPVNEPAAIQLASTTAQINNIFNRMATDNLAKQLSCSYGMDINLSTVQIFQQFAAQGQSLFQAAGDSGAYPAAVDEPSDDPYITICGGTTLGTDTNGLWCDEVVWLSPPGTDPLFGTPTPYEATGGGISLTYPIPWWQRGISMSDNQGSTTMRNLPDVASVANNVDIVYGADDPNFANFSLDVPVAGTSLAAPLWAAFMACVNEGATENGQPPIGFANPALYAIGKSTNYAACFHDITSGNNFSSNSPARYSAAGGYDLCTGWGTPNDPLIDALLAPPAENLVITPPAGFTAFGPSGGPYTVTTQTYTLTNIGSTPLSWNLINTSQWLNVSVTGGTLGPGASTSVTVSLNTAFISTNFLIGNYDANIPFWDLTDGMTENREFDLHIGNGGFETGDFTNWLFIGNTNQNITLAADDGDVAGSNALDPNVPDELFVHSGLYGGYFGQSNGVSSDAILSQTVATQPGQRYLVSFWLTCVARNGTNTPNNFTAKWNNSNLFSKTNLNPFGWTNMTYIVNATGTSTALSFAFLQNPGAFGLDDVTVETVPAPVVRSVTMSGGNVTLTWGSFSNLTYQVQTSATLINPTWSNVGSPITATNNLTTATESTGAAPQRFYRVALLPGP
jgi:subtilase family serine protease